MRSWTAAIVWIVGLACATTHAATTYSIDVNEGSNPLTLPGWTGLDAAYSGNSGSVTVDQTVFSVTSADGARVRTTPNSLTRDFVFDDGGGQAVGLTISTLPQGTTWKAEVWAYDGGTVGDQYVGISQLGGTTSIDGTTIPNTEIIYTSAFSEGPTEPFTFTFTTAEVAPGFLLFTRENNSNNRSRLSALRLSRQLPLVRYDLDDGASDVSAGSTTAQVDAVDVVAANLSASDITSGPGWGREDPANGNNANVGDGTGLETLTDDHNTWWARGSTLPSSGPDVDHFAAFTITPVGGTYLDLSEGEFGIKMGATDRDNTLFDFDVTLRTSLDGFVSDLGTASISVQDNANEPVYLTNSLDLSSLGKVAGPLEFRLYFNDNSDSGSQHPLLDTVLVFGTVVVPEPSTFLLSAVGLLAMAFCWRRRKKR